MTTVLVIVGAFLLGAIVFCVWWKVFNSADGERYLKMRMQGPFVPIETDDTEQAKVGVRMVAKAGIELPRSNMGFHNEVIHEAATANRES